MSWASYMWANSAGVPAARVPDVREGEQGTTVRWRSKKTQNSQAFVRLLDMVLLLVRVLDGMELSGGPAVSETVVF